MSCGCLARELFQGARDPLAISRQPLYAVWKAIWSRCTNPRNKAYKNYGERGVFVVDRWKDFWLFVSDMGQKPLPGREYSIDRKDNDGPYSPDNCCWSDRLRQANNQRRTVVVDFGGESRPLQDWCRELGIPASTIKSRVFQQGMTYQEAFRKSLP